MAASREASGRKGPPDETGEILEVCEIFASIQGEGALSGWPCTFVRLAGCPLACGYCDTVYAKAPGVPMPRARVRAEVRRHGVPLVELTGGEPLAQAGAFPLMRELADEGYEVLIETGGGVSIEGRDRRARIVLDVKTPGSGMVDRQKLENLGLLLPRDEIKFVICSREDYEWARDFIAGRDLAARFRVHFSPASATATATATVTAPPPGTAPPGPERPGVAARDLAKWILDDRLRVRLNLQLHTWIWGPGVRGV